IALLELAESLRRERDARAGLWLACGALKPQLLLAPALALLLSRRGRAIVAAGVAGTLVGLACALALGWRIWASFAAALAGAYRGPLLHPERLDNLRGTILFAFWSWARGPADWVGALGLVATS